MTDKSRSPEILRLTQSLEKNPESRLFVPLAEAYLQSEMPEEAVTVLSDGIQHHPMFVAARVMLGKIQHEKGALPEAKTQFEHVIGIAPSNIPSLKGLADISRKEGRKNEARDFYQRILEIDPTDKTAHTLLNELDAKESTGNTVEDLPKLPEDSVAPEVTKQETTPSSHAAEEEPHLTQTMASLYMTQGHFREAADIYENLLKQYPADPAIQEGLKTARQALHDTSAPEVPQPLSVEEKIERLQAWLETIQKHKRTHS
ncbi:MAG: tetratricopeptide repeat protein [Nitrospiria bacterium]